MCIHNYNDSIHNTYISYVIKLYTIQTNMAVD